MDRASKAIHGFSVAFLALAIIGFMGIINDDPISFEPSGAASEVSMATSSCSDACNKDLHQCLDTAARVFNTCEEGPTAAECFDAGADYMDGCVALAKACEATC
jgi:hypothetical protein